MGQGQDGRSQGCSRWWPRRNLGPGTGLRRGHTVIGAVMGARVILGGGRELASPRPAVARCKPGGSRCVYGRVWHRGAGGSEERHLPGSSAPEAPVRASPPAGAHLSPILRLQPPRPHQDPALATSSNISQVTSKDPSLPDTIRFPTGLVEGGRAGDPVPVGATEGSREMGQPPNKHLCSDSCRRLLSWGKEHPSSSDPAEPGNGTLLGDNVFAGATGFS